jgi:hypothetical protein
MLNIEILALLGLLLLPKAANECGSSREWMIAPIFLFVTLFPVTIVLQMIFGAYGIVEGAKILVLTSVLVTLFIVGILLYVWHRSCRRFRSGTTSYIMELVYKMRMAIIFVVSIDVMRRMLTILDF